MPPVFGKDFAAEMYSWVKYVSKQETREVFL